METCEIIRQEMGGFPFLRIKGYFNKETGLKLAPIIDELLESGKIRIIMDLGECTVLNSPGVSALLGLTFKIVDDFKGKLVLFGLNELKSSVLEFTGVTELAKTAGNADDALNEIKA